jgi:hypothetical protein
MRLVVVEGVEAQPLYLTLGDAELAELYVLLDALRPLLAALGREPVVHVFD